MTRTMPERQALVLDLSPLSTVGLGQVVAESEATRVRVKRRLRAAPTDGDHEVVNFLAWVQRLVEQEAAERDRAARRSAGGAR